jgi:hypothetical protein
MLKLLAQATAFSPDVNETYPIAKFLQALNELALLLLSMS